VSNYGTLQERLRNVGAPVLLGSSGEPGTYTPQGGTPFSASGSIVRQSLKVDEVEGSDQVGARAELQVKADVVTAPSIGDTWQPAGGEVWTVRGVVSDEKTGLRRLDVQTYETEWMHRDGWLKRHQA
jgi:hypothetical protein